jgi:uncharacterized protein (TIGR03437 family)
MTTLRGTSSLLPRSLAVIVPLLFAGCNITDAPTPDEKRFINLAVLSGGDQVGLPDSEVEPITIRMKSTAYPYEPLANREVQFRAPSQSGIVFTPAATFTDSNGIARTQVRLGSTLGRFSAEVNFPGNPSDGTPITLEVAYTPIVTSVSPSVVSANDVITISGENFSTSNSLNEVRIDGARATVINSSPARIEARVPPCFPTRSARVTVNRGALASTAMPVEVTGINGTVQSVSRGQAITISDRASLSCVRLGAQSADAEYIVITQHSANSGETSVPLRLVGLTHGLTAAARPVAQLSTMGVAPVEQGESVREFKDALRKREGEILQRLSPRTELPSPQRSVVVAIPEVGDKRNFKVFVPQKAAATIGAVVRAVGQHVVIYEDTAAAGSMPQADLEAALATLDETVIPTDLAVFGAAPDIDQNERIVVLLTPAVNRLTKANETSFINGYFYSCDLVSSADCFDTNRAEILYSIVPDPTGQWGLKHPIQRVTNLLPSLVAHEFAHLIHFNQRTLISGVRSLEDLWLSEGLAHFAEDTVAGILRGRGLTTEADLVGRENLLRAAQFLAKPEKTSLVASTGEGTLEERGASWLFLKYLNYRVGGNFLRKIESSSQSGGANVSAAAGAAWPALIRDWSVALAAAGASDLTGFALPREQTFGAFDLRGAVAAVSTSGYTLKPYDAGTGDFLVDWSMTPSTTSFVRVTAPAGSAVNLILAGERGGSLATAAQPQIIVFRTR